MSNNKYWAVDRKLAPELKKINIDQILTFDDIDKSLKFDMAINISGLSNHILLEHQKDAYLTSDLDDDNFNFFYLDTNKEIIEIIYNVKKIMVTEGDENIEKFEQLPDKTKTEVKEVIKKYVRSFDTWEPHLKELN